MSLCYPVQVPVPYAHGGLPRGRHRAPLYLSVCAPTFKTDPFSTLDRVRTGTNAIRTLDAGEWCQRAEPRDARIHKNGSFSEMEQNTSGFHLIELKEGLSYFLSPKRGVLEEGISKISKMFKFEHFLRLCSTFETFSKNIFLTQFFILYLLVNSDLSSVSAFRRKSRLKRTSRVTLKDLASAISHNWS